MYLSTEIEGVIETAAGTDLLSREALESYIASDAATVLVLEAKNRGGEDYHNGTTLRQVTTETVPDGSIVGVSVGRAFATADALTEHPYFHADPDELLAEIALSEADFPVGSVLVTCVAEGYRGAGLGERITFAALESLEDRGISPIVQFEWDRPDSPGVEKAEQAGFDPVVRLESHFPPGWDCEYCAAATNDGECRCDVVVFLK